MKDLDLLQELGFDQAHSDVCSKIERRKKMQIAYQNYQFISPEQIDKFNADLKKKTLKSTSSRDTYDKLKFIDPKNYKEVPPTDALLKMRQAKDMKCFDTFEIAKIESVEKVKDPILFGIVDGCGDKFFIAQWDDDVTIEMIKKASKDESKI